MVESVAEMAGKRKSFASPGTPGKPQKKLKTEQATPNKAKNQKNTPKKNSPQVKNNDQQNKKKSLNVSAASTNAGEKTTPERKTFSKRKFRDFIKDAATGEVKPEEALTKIQEQINKLQANDELSNTGKRKLSKLCSIADKIQKQSGINKIDISKEKSLKPMGEKVPKGQNQKPNKSATKPTKKEVQKKPNLADNKNKDATKIDQSEEQSDEWDEEGTDDSEDGEEEEEGSQEGEEDSEGGEENSEDEGSVEGEVESAEEELEEEEEEDDDGDEDDDDDGDNDHNNQEKKEVQTAKPKTNDVKKEVQLDKKEKIESDFAVFAGNLPFDITEDEVKEYFSKAGEIISVVLPIQRKFDRPRGFAIIQMKDKESFDKALAFNYTLLKGRQVYVRQFHQTTKGSANRAQGGNKRFGNQDRQTFNPYNRGGFNRQNRGGFNRQNRGGFNSQNQRPMRGGGYRGSGFRAQNTFQKKE